MESPPELYVIRCKTLFLQQVLSMRRPFTVANSRILSPFLLWILNPGPPRASLNTPTRAPTWLSQSPTEVSIFQWLGSWQECIAAGCRNVHFQVQVGPLEVVQRGEGENCLANDQIKSGEETWYLSWGTNPLSVPSGCRFVREPEHVHTSEAHGPLVRYVKLRVAHAPGMPGTFPPTTG